MREKIAFMLCLTLAVSTLAASLAHAQNSPTWTAIYVTDMHCETCAKKIARKLYATPGVREVKANVPKNLAFVVPEAGKTCSPRSLWDAVEQAGFEPVKIVSPAGTFTSKPEN
jgi:copper chaperone CopZ